MGKSQTIIVVIVLALGSLASVVFFFKYKASKLCESDYGNQYGIECQSVKIHFFPTPRFVVSQLNMTFGESNNSVWVVRIESVEGTLSLRAFYQIRLVFDGLLMSRPDIRLVETTPPLEKKNSRKTLKKIPHFEIISLQIQGGRFTYIDKDRKGIRRDGRLTFTDINLKSNALRFDGDLKKDVFLELSGGLDQGQILMQIEAKSPLKKTNVRIRAEANDINLSSANIYTEPVEGLKLSGSVRKMISVSHIHGHKVDSSVKLQYSDLDIQIQKNEERNGVESWLSEIYLDAKLCDNKKKSLKNMGYVHSLYQKADNSWVQFYLMGLLKSVLKVACFENAI